MKTLLLGLLVLTCAISEAIAAEPPTFSNQIVRVFQQHCQTCRHPGAIAPFSLTSYQDADPWRTQIREATRTRKMPTWKPVHGFGDFADVRRLSESEVSLIERWVAAGAPEGDPRDLPPAKEFPRTWSLGTPHAVLDTGVDFTVPASCGSPWMRSA